MLFFGGSLINEVDKLEPLGMRHSNSGFERKEIGASLGFGDEIDFELSVGRLGFANGSNTWLWWDEELDSIQLEASFENIEAMIALAQEKSRAATYLDFIEPDQQSLRRILATVSWEFSSNQLLQFYYLEQNDNSASYLVGDSIDSNRIDETDADLKWIGISYQGAYQQDGWGELQIEVNLARLRGRETEYDISAATATVSMVDDIASNRVDGSAQGLLLNWTPQSFKDWSLILGRFRGSGDGNPDDNRNNAFRQTGLQGDSDPYGALYQPELSNLLLTILGITYGGLEAVEISLLLFDYRQDRLEQKSGDVSIQLDTSGLSRDLGSEIDLVISLRAYDGVEVELIAAEFDPGSAYGSYQGKSSHFWQVGLSYEF